SEKSSLPGPASPLAAGATLPQPSAVASTADRQQHMRAMLSAGRRRLCGERGDADCQLLQAEVKTRVCLSGRSVHSKLVGVRANDHPAVSPFHPDVHVRDANGAGLPVDDPGLGDAALEHGDVAQHRHIPGTKFTGLELVLAGPDAIEKVRLRGGLARVT